MAPFLGDSMSCQIDNQYKYCTIVTKWDDASCAFDLVPLMFSEAKHYFMYFYHPHVYHSN